MNPIRKRFGGVPGSVLRLIPLAAGSCLVLLGVFPEATRADEGLHFRNVRAQAEQFIDYSNSVRLTPAQERIKAEALDAIPAPCCKKYSMRTCCCPCNLAKSAWGLSNYLIAKQGYGVPEVKKAVLGWLAFVNPRSFTGDACFTGGCKRPFAQNGCAGMDAAHVIVGDDAE